MNFPMCYHKEFLLHVPFGVYNGRDDILVIEHNTLRIQIVKFNNIDAIQNLIRHLFKKYTIQEIYTEFKTKTNLDYIVSCGDLDTFDSLECKIHEKFLKLISVPNDVTIIRCPMFTYKATIGSKLQYTSCYIYKSPKEVEREMFQAIELAKVL